MATKKTVTKKTPAKKAAVKNATAKRPSTAAPPAAGDTAAHGKKAAPKKVTGGKAAPKSPVKAGKAAKAAKSGKAGRKAAGNKVAVRNSPIHGRGMYAAADIAKGERVIEYVGTTISWKAADERPPSDPNDPNHTFLFSLSDGKRVIDASQDGNDARWINHSCDPNCETEESGSGRVFIEAIRDISSGEELNYDYCLIIDEKITKKLRLQYECRCGAEKCRGTMLALPKRKKKKKKH
jgi:hypothetical protein